MLIPAIVIGFTALTLASNVDLRGGVQHQERFPSEALSSKDRKWFKVPGWLVGSWDQISCSRIYESDEHSHSEDLHAHAQPLDTVLTFGIQRDARGGVWQPELTHTKHNKATTTRKTSMVDDASAGEPSVTLRTYRTLHDNNEVVREETLERIAPIAWNQGILVVETDTQSYDGNGFPKRRIKKVSMFKRSADFTPKNVDGDVDLQSYFVEFLRNSGYPSLIPTSGQQEVSKP
jgi:hypothetical protein